MAVPETILQFGAGRFLRGFVDRFVQQATDGGQAVGQAVVVQSTPGQRAELLNGQPQGYHVLVRGYQDGQLVERLEQVRTISRALTAEADWSEVVKVAVSPDLKWIVTNATESGYVLRPEDGRSDAPPKTLPAKLTQLLWARYQQKGSPLTLLPCELIEGNAHKLRDLVLSQARTWGLEGPFADWVREDCLWLNNLVDCIVTRAPTDHPLAATDPLMISAEPFALWAIERPQGREVPLFSNPAIQLVDDLKPFYLRKVRILNGLHTAMAARYEPLGFQTVQEVLENRDACRWLRGVLFEEIVPTIAYKVEDVAEFADTTFDRLRNPYLHHRLSDILMNHADKVRVRLEPTREKYEQLFGRPPRRLSELLSKKS